MILPFLAKRMQFDSRLLDLQFLAPSNQPIRELRPLSTNQILDPLDLGTLKSAKTQILDPLRSLNVSGSGIKPNLSNCQNCLAVGLRDEQSSIASFILLCSQDTTECPMNSETATRNACGALHDSLWSFCLKSGTGRHINTIA